MDSRERNGLIMAMESSLRINDDERGIWLVPSQTTAGRMYRVFNGSKLATCTCEDFTRHRHLCKHVWCVRYWLLKEDGEELPEVGPPPEPAPPKRKRQSRAYSKSLEYEKEHLQVLLRELCRPLPTPPPDSAGGRPKLRVPDMVFAMVLKVYSMFSHRRAMTDIRQAHKDGYLTQVPSRNSVSNGMGDEDLTPVLKRLIIESSAPLRALEKGHYAQDATGITTGRYRRWVDERLGTDEQKRDWVKLTLFCGVETKVVAAVEVLDGIANESPYFPRLLGDVAKHNRVLKVSADSLFSTVDNLHAADEIGAVLYSPFKDYSTPERGGLWAKMYHMYHLHRDEFMRQYKKQNIAESTFSAIKRLFGEAVKSKTDVAMKNEVLCKVLCYNIVQVIRSHYELGIAAEFWKGDEVATR